MPVHTVYGVLHTYNETFMGLIHFKCFKETFILFCNLLPSIKKGGHAGGPGYIPTRSGYFMVHGYIPVKCGCFMVQGSQWP